MDDTLITTSNFTSLTCLFVFFHKNSKMLRNSTKINCLGKRKENDENILKGQIHRSTAVKE